MAFLKRLGFYLIGLSIGMVFLAYIFKKKSEETGVYFCYLPDCRTLKDIRSKTVSYSDQVNALLKSGTIDSVDINDLLTNGDIDFGNSDTKSTPCKTYLVNGQIKEKQTLLTVKNCETEAFVESIEY